MSDQRIQKALNFLRNDKSTFQTVSGQPLEKKLEFLRMKLPPAEFQQVLKRYEDDSFSRDFGGPPAPQLAPAPQKSGVFGMIGAAILGAVGATFMLSGKPNKKEPLQSDPEIRRSASLQEIAQPRLQELILKQAEAIERMSSQIANLQYAIQTLKKDKIEEEKVVNPEDVFDRFVGEFGNEDSKIRAFKSIRLWFNNISLNPEDKKVRRINMTNPAYKAQLAGNSQTGEFFRSAGFDLVDNFWEFRKEHLERLRRALGLVQNVLNTATPVFMKNEPWKIANSQPAEASVKGQEEAKKEEDKTQVVAEEAKEGAHLVEEISGGESVVIDKDEKQPIVGQDTTVQQLIG